MKNEIPSWNQLLHRGVREGQHLHSLGPMGSRELIGVCFMKKDKKGFDHVNFSPDHYSFSLVLKGKGRYHREGSPSLDLMPGMAFQRFPGHVHSTEILTSNTWLECFISLGDLTARALVANGWVSPQQPVLHLQGAHVWLEEFIRLHLRFLKLEDRQSFDFTLQCLSLIEKLCHAEHQGKDSLQHRMTKAGCLLLSQNLHEPMAIDQICSKQGWDYHLFRRAFKERMGISPHQYRIRRRIDEAKRHLMAEDAVPLKQLARDLGYNNVYEFSAQFKKITGLPPGQYRKGSAAKKTTVNKANSP